MGSENSKFEKKLKKMAKHEKRKKTKPNVFFFFLISTTRGLPLSTMNSPTTYYLLPPFFSFCISTTNENLLVAQALFFLYFFLMFPFLLPDFFNDFYFSLSICSVSSSPLPPLANETLLTFKLYSLCKVMGYTKITIYSCTGIIPNTRWVPE